MVRAIQNTPPFLPTRPFFGFGLHFAQRALSRWGGVRLGFY